MTENNRENEGPFIVVKKKERKKTPKQRESNVCITDEKSSKQCYSFEPLFLKDDSWDNIPPWNPDEPTYVETKENLSVSETFEQEVSIDTDEPCDEILATDMNNNATHIEKEDAPNTQLDIECRNEVEEKRIDCVSKPTHERPAKKVNKEKKIAKEPVACSNMYKALELSTVKKKAPMANKKNAIKMILDADDTSAESKLVSFEANAMETANGRVDGWNEKSRKKKTRKLNVPKKNINLDPNGLELVNAEVKQNESPDEVINVTTDIQALPKVNNGKAMHKKLNYEILKLQSQLTKATREKKLYLSITIISWFCFLLAYWSL